MANGRVGQRVSARRRSEDIAMVEVEAQDLQDLRG